jgi:hypothetical protein
MAREYILGRRFFGGPIAGATGAGLDSGRAVGREAGCSVRDECSFPGELTRAAPRTILTVMKRDGPQHDG